MIRISGIVSQVKRFRWSSMARPCGDITDNSGLSGLLLLSWSFPTWTRSLHFRWYICQRFEKVTVQEDNLDLNSLKVDCPLSYCYLEDAMLGTAPKGSLCNVCLMDESVCALRLYSYSCYSFLQFWLDDVIPLPGCIMPIQAVSILFIPLMIMGAIS